MFLSFNLLGRPSRENPGPALIHILKCKSIASITDESYNNNTKRCVEGWQVTWCILGSEKLTSDYPSEITPAVKAEDERSFARSWGVARQPDNGEGRGGIGAKQKDAEADISWGWASNNANQDEANECNPKTTQSVVSPFLARQLAKPFKWKYKWSEEKVNR
jgi:hypothetical protein